MIVAAFTAALAASALASPIEGFKTGHPRLFVSDDEVVRVKGLIVRDALAAKVFEELTRRARRILKEPPVRHELRGPRMLAQSRDALRRIATLSGVYRLTGYREFLERARAELRAAAALADWNPRHFLDTAEMTAALAIGYDWLFRDLSPEERRMIRKAIATKGLEEGLKVYARPQGWHKKRHNWNQVCNGGLLLGALAIADEEPELARRVIDASRESLPLAMSSFAPDGGWPEGPGYWDYATIYNVLYLDAARTALGTDFGLSESSGFSHTGDFRLQFAGPTGRPFNFADAPEYDVGALPQLFWLARRFSKPGYAAAERAVLAEHGVGGNRFGVFDLFWLEPESAPAPPPALDAAFRGVDVAFLRGAWNDPGATFVGFKGGDNDANHSHLDLGTFVLDAAGQRWAVDLGPDDYELPGYFKEERWTYYRLRTEGHNTLTLNGENQDRSAEAPLIAFVSTSSRAFAVADLSAAYRPTARRVLRGIALLQRRDVLVQDELDAPEPAAATWNFHTRASVSLDGGARAVLRQGGATLYASLLSPPGARFLAVSGNPPSPQAQQPDVTNLMIALPDKTRSARIAVFLSPHRDQAAPALVPLADWSR